MAIEINDFRQKMEKAIDALEKEFTTIRAGRANPKLLDQVVVDYYGAETPLNQLASVQVPEARVLQVVPYDANALAMIEKALYASDLGLTPNNDGKSIRLTIPQLTEETRKDLAKEVNGIAETSKVEIRNIRRELMDKIKKDDELTEDQQKKSEKQAQELTDEFVKTIENVTKEKEKELLSI